MRTDGAPAGRRSAGARVLSLLNRYSLKTLLLASVLLLVLFCTLVVAYVVASREITLRMTDALISVDNAIAEACLRSNAAMIDARRLEKDFLLNYREFGFDESRSRYLNRLIAAVADIQGHMRRIRELAGDRETAARTLEVEGALERYRQGVGALADSLGQRDATDGGVRAALRREARGLEVQAARIGDDALLAALLAVQRVEGDYLERELDTDARAVREALGRFTAAAAASVAPAVRERLRLCTECYLALFERYV